MICTGRVLTINCQPSSIGEINLCYQNYISTGNYETEANLLIVNSSMDIMIISGSECLHYAYAHTDSILNFPSLGWQDRDQDTSRTCDLGPVPTGACVCGHGWVMGTSLPMVWCCCIIVSNCRYSLHLLHCYMSQISRDIGVSRWLSIVTTFLLLLPSSSNQSYQ